jgi:hypothetical protein
MKPLTARLDRLEELASPKTPSLLLFLRRQAGTESGDELITGIRADGDRLPALQRQQGESVNELTDRARTMITGGGVVIVHYSREGW